MNSVCPVYLQSNTSDGVHKRKGKRRAIRRKGEDQIHQANRGKDRVIRQIEGRIELYGEKGKIKVIRQSRKWGFTTTRIVLLI